MGAILLTDGLGGQDQELIIQRSEVTFHKITEMSAGNVG